LRERLHARTVAELVHAAIRAGLLSPLRPSVPPRRDDWLGRALPGNGAGPRPRRRVWAGDRVADSLGESASRTQRQAAGGPTPFPARRGSVLVGIELVRPGHHHDQRSQRVQHLDRPPPGVGGAPPGSVPGPITSPRRGGTGRPEPEGRGHS
jgi:hypothetical protein